MTNPDWASIFAPNGRLLREGEIIRRTNLSLTLTKVAREGADAFYTVIYSSQLASYRRSNVVILGLSGRRDSAQSSTGGRNFVSCRPQKL